MLRKSSLILPERIYLFSTLTFRSNVNIISRIGCDTEKHLDKQSTYYEHIRMTYVAEVIKISIYNITYLSFYEGHSPLVAV